MESLYNFTIYLKSGARLHLHDVKISHRYRDGTFALLVEGSGLGRKHFFPEASIDYYFYEESENARH